ncbi:hypothetical protein U9M48_023145 [Paspalum notatum var. saurae]|uniref:Uncharacterized protein n=1 Tax=Paspalum notatum var. saurae TaxID=547442 RepID=A0AAQ3TNT2_PASNO
MVRERKPSAVVSEESEEAPPKKVRWAVRKVQASANKRAGPLAVSGNAVMPPQASSSHGQDKGEEPLVPSQGNVAQVSAAPQKEDEPALSLHSCRRIALDIFTHLPKPKDYGRKSVGVFEKRWEPPVDDGDSMFLNDHRFHTLFQCDFYDSVIIERKDAITNQKWIHWTHCESMHDPALDAALAKLIEKGMKDIMFMPYDWSEEVIAQFYSTVWFEKAHNTIMHFMIEGKKYQVTYTQFRDILGFEKADTAKSRPRVHALRKIPSHDLAHMFYEGTKVGDYGSTQHLLPYYKYLHSLIRSTIAPKSGDLSHLQTIIKSLLTFFSKHGPKFSVFDFIWEKIVACACNSLKIRTHAPYLMKMIEEVTNKNYVKEITHESYRVKKIIPRHSVDVQLDSSPPVPPSHLGTSRAATTKRSLGANISSSTFMTRALKSIFKVCIHNATEIREERVRTNKVLKKIDERHQNIFTKLNLTPPTSPLVDDDEVPSMPHFDDPFVFYENMENKCVEEMNEGNDKAVVDDEENGNTTDEDMDED